MDRKGFTLIELIVTIVLLSVISMISYVSINKILMKSKNDDCKNIEKTIKNAMTQYVSDNRYNTSINLNGTITGDKLSSYFNSDIINPYTKEEIVLNSITISYTLFNDYTLNKVESIKINGNTVTCNDKMY